MTDLATRLAFDTARTSVVTTAALPVPTVASVRLVSSSAGPVLVTSGRTSAGDGGGGTWAWDPTSTDSDDGALSVAVTGVTTGRWKRQYTGPIDVRWFGAVGDGVTDDTAAITSAIQQAENGEVYIPPGTYAVTTIALNTNATKNRSVRLRGAHGAVYSGTGRTVLKGTTAAEILRIGDTDTTAGSSSPMQVEASDLHLDGDGIATTGLRVTRGVNLTFKRITATDCTSKGIFVDGTVACSAASADLNALLFESCYTTRCGTSAGDGGLVISAPGPAVGSFDNFRIVGHQSGSGDYCGIRVSKTGGVHVQTSVIQPTGNGVEVADAEVTIDSTYVECGGTTLVATAAAFGGTSVKLRGCSIGNISADDNSSVIYDAGYANAGAPGCGHGVERYSIGKVTDDALWGPPTNYGKPGAVWKRGMRWQDAFGITWVCTTSGSGEAARFVPRDGRIIRPIPYTELTNGIVLWWAQEDTIIRGVSLLTGGAYAFTNTDATQTSSLTTYLTSTVDDLIDAAQLTNARLTGATEVVSQASRTASASKRMAAKEELFFVGSASNVAPAAGNYIKHFLNHNPPGLTAGTGLLMLDVYPLRMA